MANARSVPRGNLAFHGQLTAGTADVITFTDEVGQVEVLTDGTAEVWVSTDGTAPAAAPATNAASDLYRQPATGGWNSAVYSVSDRTVALFCAVGTPKYSVHKAS